MLPPEFWYFAIKYTVEVSNYIPIQTANKKSITTPLYKAYNTHSDLRNKLFPLFSPA